MAKNRSSILPNHQTFAMPPAHPHTVSIVASMFNQDDEDEDDICPVCDGECTCNNRPRVAHQTPALNRESLQNIGTSSSSSASYSLSHPPPAPLKIKLTLPPKLLGNKKHPSGSNRLKSNQETTSVSAPAGETSCAVTHGIKSHPPPKPRGRPPKAVPTVREVAKAQAAAARISSSPTSRISQPYKNVGSNKRKKSGPLQKKRSPKSNRPGPKRPLKRKHRATNHISESSLSELTDIDYDCDDDVDGESGKFPTFISASVLSSIGSDDDSSDSSDSSDLQSLSLDGDDSDIEKEEESFIVSEAHVKARLRRELLGNEDRRDRGPQNDWVIRPRKKSVDPSDNEMDVDSDATEDEEEEGEQDLDEDDEETDERRAGGSHSGLVTAWSDDDESSFDADIFFANLTGSDSDSDSSCSRIDSTGDDGDHSDIDAASHSDAAELMMQRHELENLQLEVTQGWDGQIVFSNGLHEGRGILDIDFEVEASQYMAESSPSRARDSDVDMSSGSGSTSAEEDGYEEDADGGEGDTTDEELVGEDDLPNERAMKLFSLPFNVSAIDPLSTVSPVVSPRRRMRSSSGSIGSPKPEDILAGRVSWDSEDHDYDEFDWEGSKSGSQRSSRLSGPRPGVFTPVQETRQAIIDGSKEVPSPHPRFNRRRSHSTTTRINSVEQALRKRLLDNTKSTPTFATASELLSPFQLLSSDDFGSPTPSVPMSAFTEEPESLSSSINLDDVLEASFLAPESAENSDNSARRMKDSTGEGDKLAAGKHLQNLGRWDTISVGAFRQTRENGGWNSDTHPHPHTPHSSIDYNSIMKASPLSAIMWPKEKERRRRQRNLSLSEPMTISPVILPVRDGDATPTRVGTEQQHSFEHDFGKHMQKFQKESRRERKLKKKNWGPVHHHHSHHNQKHHSHQHHPNSKMRGSTANQRSFLTAVPPFSL